MEKALSVASEKHTDIAPLDERELSDLGHCEETISRGLQSFVEVGMAMVKIRDERLYRQEYCDFEMYCRQRWGVSRIHAHRCIDAARVHAMLPTGNKPANEAQARPLTKLRRANGDLDSKAVTRVWQRVVDTAPVDNAGRKLITAQIVEEAIGPILQRRRRRTCRPAHIVHRPLASVTEDEGETTVVEPTAAAVKMNISAEEFSSLREHVERLAKMMRTETLPRSIRLAIEDVCDIVLGNRT